MRTVLKLGCVLVFLWPIGCDRAAPDAGATASPSPQRAKYAEKVVDALAKDDLATATERFNSVALATTPATRVETMWNDVLLKCGAFKGRVGTRTETLPDHEVVAVTCDFERGVATVRLTFEEDGRISKFEMKATPGTQ